MFALFLPGSIHPQRILEQILIACPDFVHGQVQTHRGVLWIENMTSADLQLERVECDYGEKVCGSVKRCLDKFCAGDTDLLEHITNHIHSLFADGAMQKSLDMLRVGLPSIMITAKDSAHTVRILDLSLNCCEFALSEYHLI